MKFLADYHFQMKYYLGKANTVADAISRKAQLATMVSIWLMFAQFAEWYPYPTGHGVIYNTTMFSKLIDQIWAAQRRYSWYKMYKEKAN